MSIKDNALIVSLTVGKPQLSKTDIKATNAAEKAVNARNAGHYRKNLYPKHLVQPITAIESAARAYIEANTYPWARGEWLLPTVRFMKFADDMAKYELQFDQAVTAFLQNWVNVLAEAERQQGGLFNAKDYPDVSHLRSRFRFSVNYRQVTDANDFRVKLQEEELEQLRKKTEEATKQQMDDFLKEPLLRLREAIARMHETMGKPERVIENRKGHAELRPPIFRDTLVTNLVDEIALLSDFSEVLGEDATSLADDVKSLAVEPEKLRNDADLRAQAHKGSAELLAKIDAMLED